LAQDIGSSWMIFGGKGLDSEMKMVDSEGGCNEVGSIQVRLCRIFCTELGILSEKSRQFNDAVPEN
jgi:hypothetical protein